MIPFVPNTQNDETMPSYKYLDNAINRHNLRSKDLIELDEGTYVWVQNCISKKWKDH